MIHRVSGEGGRGRRGSGATARASFGVTCALRDLGRLGDRQAGPFVSYPFSVTVFSAPVCRPVCVVLRCWTIQGSPSPRPCFCSCGPAAAELRIEGPWAGVGRAPGVGRLCVCRLLVSPLSGSCAAGRGGWETWWGGGVGGGVWRRCGRAGIEGGEGKAMKAMKAMKAKGGTDKRDME